jgi:hypothetical protein
MVKPTSRRRRQAQSAGPEEQEAQGQQRQQQGDPAAGGSSSSSAAQASVNDVADGVAALRLDGAAPKVYTDPELLREMLVEVGQRTACCFQTCAACSLLVSSGWNASVRLLVSQ